MAYYDHQIMLQETDENGVSLKDHLKQAQRSGVPVPLLDEGPKLPPNAEHVWRWYLELNAARTGNGFGPNPITYEAIKAWAELMMTFPTPLEVRLIKALDEALLAYTAKKSKKEPQDAGHCET